MGRQKIFSFLVPAAFLFIVLAVVRFGNVFEYNIDEGMYTMRALLHIKGYALYHPIWMDQPPFLTLVISFFFKIFKASVFLARFITLLFSTLLVWAIYSIVAKTQNALCGVWAVVVMVFSLHYLYFSVAATATIPVIAAAVLSSYLLLRYKDTGRKRYLIFSAVIFGCAVMIKFFALVFLPGMLAEMMALKRRKKAVYLLLWLVTWFVTFLCVAGFVRVDFFQIVQPYLLARELPGDAAMPAAQYLFQWLKDASGVVPLLLAALFFTKQGQRKFFIVPLVSLITVLIVLSTHRPLWANYYLYMIIPLIWTASYGVYALYLLIQERWAAKDMFLSARDTAAIIFLAIGLGASLMAAYIQYPHVRWQLMKPELDSRLHDSDRRNIIGLMKKYALRTHMVVTDRPIYAFYAGLLADPYLSTFSSKRIRCGLLTAKDYLDIVTKERPELILFTENTRQLGQGIEPFLQKDYTLDYKDIHSADKEALYVLKNIRR